MKTQKNILQIFIMMIPPIFLLIFRKLTMIYKRCFVKKKLASSTKLHLGCGPNVLNNWANIDINISNNNQVIKWDLTEPLPVSPETIEYIFSEHFIEHLTLEQAKELLSDCYQILQSGGVLRLSTPNLKKLIDEYLSGNITEWLDVGWDPVTPCQMVNECFRLWGHQFVYDYDELKRILNEAGFSHSKLVEWHKSPHDKLNGLEFRPFHCDIIIEATK